MPPLTLLPPTLRHGGLLLPCIPHLKVLPSSAIEVGRFVPSIGGWQVLTQVYPDPRNVDDELVESIRVPSLDPNAPEVGTNVCTMCTRLWAPRTQIARNALLDSSFFFFFLRGLRLLWRCWGRRCCRWCLSCLGEIFQVCVNDGLIVDRGHPERGAHTPRSSQRVLHAP